MKHFLQTSLRSLKFWEKDVHSSSASEEESPNSPRQDLMMQSRSNYKETWNNLVQSMDTAKLYVAGYTDEDLLNQTGLGFINQLEELVGIKPSDIVLEIGCGVGRVGKLLSPKCAKWIGTDISPNILQYAAQRLQGLKNVEFVELSTVGLQEIPDNSVDVVYCTVVFMHLYEWDRYQYVKEAFRVLKPGGRCYFDNVDITSNHGWKVFMDGFSVDIKARPAHISMVSTGDELETYARKAGLENVRIDRRAEAWVIVTGIKPAASA